MNITVKMLSDFKMFCYVQTANKVALECTLKVTNAHDAKLCRLKRKLKNQLLIAFYFSSPTIIYRVLNCRAHRVIRESFPRKFGGLKFCTVWEGTKGKVC